MERSEKNQNKTLGKILLGSSIFLVLASCYFESFDITLAVLIGSGVGLANFYLYTVIVRGLTGNLDISRAKLFLVISFKFLILFAIIGLIILKTDVRPLPLLVGLSNIFLAVLLYSIKDIFHA